MVSDDANGGGAEPLPGLLHGHPETAFDYFEFRRLMAGSVAELAATRATEADLARIAACVQALEDAHLHDDPDQEAAADTDFHTALCEAAGNPVTTRVMLRIFEMLRGGVFYDRCDLYRRRGVRDGFLVQHRAMWQAILARDPQLARTLSEAHIDATEDALREARDDDARREVALRRQDGIGLTSSRR
ncbi:FCD domain-containing protein [Magnetospirillum fulvum]|uniref:FCD domain-containing protein n=1 Tax=Magnetospirillum fulvum TaxID=1082 RepID=A0A1H6JVG5_MAGFU|nr:FCD domain-containing protein [Magnetospirillum fulvum]SEH64604.1 FCD domain-containing protein [Magnetospirillum fulvum]